jgi:hypothetical protein
MRARGLRRGDGGDQRTPAGRSRVSLAGLGFRRSVAKRWQTRARGAPARSFNVRLAEADGVDDVKALVAEATRAKRRAQGRNDAAALAIAVVQRMAAERRGGVLLLSGSDATIGSRAAGRWRRFARMSDSEFGAAVEAGDENAGRSEASAPWHPPLVMTRTEFKANEFGNLSRSIFAVEAEHKSST